MVALSPLNPAWVYIQHPESFTDRGQVGGMDENTTGSSVYVRVCFPCDIHIKGTASGYWDRMNWTSQSSDLYIVGKTRNTRPVSLSVQITVTSAETTNNARAHTDAITGLRVPSYLLGRMCEPTVLTGATDVLWYSRNTGSLTVNAQAWNPGRLVEPLFANGCENRTTY